MLPLPEGGHTALHTAKQGENAQGDNGIEKKCFFFVLHIRNWHAAGAVLRILSEDRSAGHAKWSKASARKKRLASHIRKPNALLYH